MQAHTIMRSRHPNKFALSPAQPQPKSQLPDIFSLKKETGEGTFKITVPDEQHSNRDSVSSFHKKDVKGAKCVYKAVSDFRTRKRTSSFYIGLEESGGKKPTCTDFKVSYVKNREGKLFVKVTATGYLNFLFSSRKRDAAALQVVLNQLPTDGRSYDEIEASAWTTTVNENKQQRTSFITWLFGVKGTSGK